MSLQSLQTYSLPHLTLRHLAATKLDTILFAFSHKFQAWIDKDYIINATKCLRQSDKSLSNTSCNLACTPGRLKSAKDSPRSLGLTNGLVCSYKDVMGIPEEKMKAWVDLDWVPVVAGYAMRTIK